jgi:hypothetical protein
MRGLKHLGLLESCGELLQFSVGYSRFNGGDMVISPTQLLGKNGEDRINFPIIFLVSSSGAESRLFLQSFIAFSQVLRQGGTTCVSAVLAV